MTKPICDIAMLIGVIMVVLGFTTNVHAACGGNFCTGRINHLDIGSGGGVWVATDQNEDNLACVPGTGLDTVIRLNRSHQYFREMYEVLRESLIFGKAVTIRIVTGSNPCQIQYLVMYRVAPAAAASKEANELVDDAAIEPDNEESTAQ